MVTYNGSFVCKVIHKEKRLLMSAPDDYVPVYISPEDVFCLEGVVTRSIRLHKPCAEFSKCQ
ncbi:hypothetical protein PAT01_32240 [Pseudoalteromonas atlantica]|uniref:Peptidase S24/S26A/S26B/S26C domain-containing protein n=1 Tax=Pseudoalteromonas atlantica TaxID=288 RepID=A0ABQ0UHI5_PSEAF|nr:hypothetical protein PAT01_32240 [Pseudoalteromonas atlantica]